jgi:hypothetical protein
MPVFRLRNVITLTMGTQETTLFER